MYVFSLSRHTSKFLCMHNLCIYIVWWIGVFIYHVCCIVCSTLESAEAMILVQKYDEMEELVQK